jgi:hypothetical protein
VTPGRFRPLDQAALERLDDDALIEYMREARRAGDPSAALALATGPTSSAAYG